MARLEPPLRGAGDASERALGDPTSALVFIKDVVLLRAAGSDLVRDRWRGTDEGLALVLGAAGMELRKDEV